MLQVLSEKNDTSFYTFWLLRWRASGAKLPRQVVTDMGEALQNAISLGFNSMSFHVYNDLCLHILLGKKIFFDIPTQLSTDIAHFQHALSMWPCFKNIDPKVKEFYLRSSGFLTTVDNLKDFVRFLQWILIVCYSEEDSDDCKLSISNILKRIETFNFHDINTTKISDNSFKDSAFVNEEVRSEPNRKKRLTTSFIDNIKSQIKSRVDTQKSKKALGVQRNDYYLSDFGDRLATISYEFPCWSAVMNSHFKNSNVVASSACSETYFGEVKKGMVNKNSKADKFLVKYCRDIDADMLLARAKLNNLVPNLPQEIAMEIGSDNYLKASERWKHHYEENTEYYEISIDGASIIANNEIETNIKKEDDSMFDLNPIKKLQISMEHSYSTFQKDSPVSSSPMSKLPNQELKSNPPLKNDNIKVKAKKRGVYVSKCTDIQQRLQRPENSKPRGKGVIQNGNRLFPIRFNKKK